MKNACFVIPYFGRFPQNFDVFLRTCASNLDFDWMIITDDHSYHSYPANVHIKYSTFYEFQLRVQSNFDFKIELPYPYKICDFRAAFGEIFAEELKDYRFWGHCDLDQYFGTIRNFVTDDVLASYDKILCLGHFTLFRNTSYINTLYRTKDIHYGQSYKDAFSDNQHWIFDEWPIEKHTSSNRIFKQEGVRTWFCPECFSDLKPFMSRFQRTLFDYERENWTDDEVKNEIFLWKDGRLYRCYNELGSLVKQEILYAHIRQRNMDYEKYDCGKNEFVIAPNYLKSADEFTDDELSRVLRRTELRAVFHPDEIGRKVHLMRGFFQAGIRKIIRTIEKK